MSHPPHMDVLWRCYLASLPGLPTIQFLIACSIIQVAKFSLGTCLVYIYEHGSPRQMPGTSQH